MYPTDCSPFRALCLLPDMPPILPCQSSPSRMNTHYYRAALPTPKRQESWDSRPKAGKSIENIKKGSEICQISEWVTYSTWQFCHGLNVYPDFLGRLICIYASHCSVPLNMHTSRAKYSTNMWPTFRSANPLKLGAIIFCYFNMFCSIDILNSIISRFWLISLS